MGLSSEFLCSTFVRSHSLYRTNMYACRNAGAYIFAHHSLHRSRLSEDLFSTFVGEKILANVSWQNATRRKILRYYHNCFFHQFILPIFNTFYGGFNFNVGYNSNSLCFFPLRIIHSNTADHGTYTTR